MSSLKSDDNRLKQQLQSYIQQKLSHDIIVDLPAQIEKFFEIQQFDMQDDDILASPTVCTVQMNPVDDSSDLQTRASSIAGGHMSSTSQFEIPAEFSCRDENEEEETKSPIIQSTVTTDIIMSPVNFQDENNEESKSEASIEGIKSYNNTPSAFDISCLQ